MRLAPPLTLAARRHQEPSPWEFWLRYGAATASTLIALAGAQLILRANALLLFLALLTVIGTPVSIALRRTDMKIAGLSMPRPLWNAITVLLTLGLSSYLTIESLADVLWRTSPSVGFFQAFWVRFGAGEAIGLIMQVFLIFAALRSFALISDKDCTLTTIPAFSTLLLLIPVHKGIEVVMYYILWTVVATVLLALDHRAESRALATAFVPGVTPGQEVRLSARGLASVLGFSLVGAIGLSYFLSSRDPQQRSQAEMAVTNLASRLTQFALALPDSSVNGGPERQIDFSSGPSLPSRALLWRVTTSVRGTRPVRPAYWRMFTLSDYDGATWSQNPGVSCAVKRQLLSFAQWPPSSLFRGGPARTRDGFWWRGGPPPAFSPGPRPEFFGSPRVPGAPFGRGRRRFGFDIAAQTANRHNFGPPTLPVRQILEPATPSVGFVPLLPAPRTVILPENERQEVQFRPDDSIDVGVVQVGNRVQLLSDVPLAPEYGGNGAPPLLKRQTLNPTALLDPDERARALQLPPTLPQRVRDFGADVLRGRPATESNLRRAQRLAFAVQDGAVYTLRPPQIPTGRDATDFFLFEGTKRGYCTYFAGALTTLCRTQGIPARIVSGFAFPEWVSGSGGVSTAIIREANAHAWTEVWVDNWGWAVVDATPSGDRGNNAPTWMENWGDFFQSHLTNFAIWTRLHLKTLLFLALTLVSIGFWMARRNLRAGFGPSLWPHRAPAGGERARIVITRAYNRMSRRLARRFRPRASWETPDEWLEAAQTTLQLAQPAPLRELTRLYLLARYHPRPLPDETAVQAMQALGKLSLRQLKLGR